MNGKAGQSLAFYQYTHIQFLILMDIFKAFISQQLIMYKLLPGDMEKFLAFYFVPSSFMTRGTKITLDFEQIDMCAEVLGL